MTEPPPPPPPVYVTKGIPAPTFILIVILVIGSGVLLGSIIGACA